MIYTRVISTLLAASLCLSLCPMQALAVQVNAQLRVEASSEGTVTVSGAETGETQGKRLALTVSGAQHIARDYDQTLHVLVTNHSSVQALYYLECDNPYDDLSMNFVMTGSYLSPLAIDPGETQSVELGVFAQNAEQTSYTVPIQSKVLDGQTFVTDSTMQLMFACDPGDGVVSIVPSGEPDKNTLARPYTITNVGDCDIADLGLTIQGDGAEYLRLDPIVSNHALAVGESVTVDLVPDLAKMKRDNQSVLTGSIVPAGGVASVADAAPETRALSAQPAIARSANSGASFAVNVNLDEVKTISAADLAMYQDGNPFYDSEFVQDAFQITANVDGQQTDLGALSKQYWDPDDTSKDGVNTPEEFDAVLGKMIDPDTQTYDLTVSSKLRYTDESGGKSEVGITVSSSSQLIEEKRETDSLQAEYYYDAEKDELTIVTVVYNPDVQGYLDEVNAGIAAAREELDIAPAISGNVARSARGVDWGSVMERSATTFSNAGLNAFANLADEAKKLDFSDLQTPQEISEYMDTMKRVNDLAEATAPVRTAAKYLNTAATTADAFGDMMETADVWNDPNIPLTDKMGYTAVMTVKHTFGHVITPFMVTTGATLGGILLDGVGVVAGATLGAVAGGCIADLAEKDLQMYKQLFAQMRFRILGFQCTNRDKIIINFRMPETKRQQSASGGEEGLSACLEDGVYVTSRTYEGQPLFKKYADEELGGDTFRHYREMETDYWLNGELLDTQVENGLSEVAVAELSGPEVTEALQSGENTLERQYSTDPGHYMVETESTVTVAPGSDFEMGYAGSLSGLPDVRQMSDFAVYAENIRPEKTVVIGEENTVNATVYNLGSAGGWTNVTVQYKDKTLHHEQNVYIAPFSSEKITFQWTPEDEQNTLTVSLDRPETGVDGIALDTGEIDDSNNEASAQFEARHRIVPRLIKWPERILYTNVPYFATEVADADDVQSVQVQINDTRYSSVMQEIYSDGEKVLRATASLIGLANGSYDATVRVNYYATDENGKTETRTLTQVVPISVQQYGQIVCYVDTSQSSIRSAMVLCPNSEGKLEAASSATVSRTMGTSPSKCTIKYDPDVLTSIEDCIFVAQYRGSPGGLVVAPLQGLEGKTLSVTGEGFVKATIAATDNESFSYNYLTQIDGMPMADPEEIQLPADSSGSIYFCGAESIEINARVTLTDPSISAYVKIPLSRESADHTLSDYYSAFELPVEDNLSSYRLQRIDTLLTDVDGSVRNGSGAYWQFDFSDDGSDDRLAVFLPFSTAGCTAVEAALFYNNGNYLTAYYDADLRASEPLSKDRCSKVSFRLPDGGNPYGITVTVTKQGIGQALQADCNDMYLGAGAYDLKVQYRLEAGGPSYTHIQQMIVTDNTPQTVTLPLPAAAAAAAPLARADGQTAEVSWPALFFSAKLLTQTDDGWSGETTVENGAVVSLPDSTAQVQLNLSGNDRTATVLATAKDKIAVGDVFTGTAAAARSSYTAGDTMTLQLSDLLDAGGTELTAYRASTGAAALSGTVVLTGKSGTYSIPVTVADLQAGVKAALPSDLPAGQYNYTVSLLTEQTVDAPDGDDDSDDTGDEGSGGGSVGGGGGSASSAYPAVSVDGIGGTVTAENGTVIMRPDGGYEIGSITVNGTAVDIPEDGKLTGCQRDDKVVVTFVKTASEDWDNPFWDVQADAWYYDAVRYVYQNSIMQGTGAVAFSPEDTTTRAMIVTMLYRLEGAPEAAASVFADVAADQWYADAVGWAAANGVVNGVSETAFAPDNPITREQMAAILYRYAAWKGYDISASQDLSAYSDAVQISAYAQTAMQWANAEGLITGSTATALNPAGNATRAEVAAILMRFMQKFAA